MNEIEQALTLLKHARRTITQPDAQQVCDSFIEKMQDADIDIRKDDMPMNPRTEHSPVGAMYTPNTGFDIGDKDADNPMVEQCSVCKSDADYCQCEDGTDYRVKGWYFQAPTAQDPMPRQRTQDDIDDGFDGDPVGCQTQAQWDALPVRSNGSSDDWIERKIDDTIAFVMPLTFTVHGLVAASVGSRTIEWDENADGWVYITKEQLQYEFNGDMDCAEACITAEVEVYNHYLRSDVWMLDFTDRLFGGESACIGGYYGDKLDDTGMLEVTDPRYHPLVREAWERRFDA